MAINIEDLRISQDSDSLGETEASTGVKVRKPAKQNYFRVNPDEDMRLDTRLLYYEPEGEWYLVNSGLWSALFDELASFKLVVCMDMFNEVFLWPIKLPGPDGKRNTWSSSAMAAADLATKSWIRLVPSQARSKYLAKVANSGMKEPEWPEESFVSLLEFGFSEHQINDLNHPVVRKLRGEL